MGPKVRWLRKHLENSSNGCFLISDSTDLVYLFGFLQEEGRSQLFIMGPLAVDVTSTR